MSTAPLSSSKISVLFTEEHIAERVEALAQIMAKELSPNLMIVGLLRGSFIFIADLIRAMNRTDSHPQLDFLTLSSYGSGMVSSGKVQINRDMAEPVEGRDVLIVDDILESGGTLSFARDLLKERGAKSIKIAVLLDKKVKRRVPIEADYVGFTIPDKFVVGYGLDYANYHRELPYIGVVE